MKIRKATKKDLNEIADFFRAGYGKKPYYGEWTKESVLRNLLICLN